MSVSLMGTYLYVKSQDRKIRAMEAFLKWHFREPSLLFDWTDAESDLGPPQRGKEVCAYAKKADFGYYYPGWIPHEVRDYIHSVMRWAALHIGRKENFPADYMEGIDKATNFLVIYVEDESLPLVIRAKYPAVPEGWPNDKYITCDENGWDPRFRPLPEGTPSTGPWVEIRERKEKAAPIIQRELRRLDFLWRTRPAIEVPEEVACAVRDIKTGELPLVLCFKKGHPSRVMAWEHIRKAGPAYGAPPDERNYTHWRRCHSRHYWAWYVPPRFMSKDPA